MSCLVLQQTRAPFAGGSSSEILIRSAMPAAMTLLAMSLAWLSAVSIASASYYRLLPVGEVSCNQASNAAAAAAAAAAAIDAAHDALLSRIQDDML